jgi:peptidoglycan-associated lipoprotein
MKARKLWIVAAAGLAIAGCGRDTLPVSGTGSGLGTAGDNGGGSGGSGALTSGVGSNAGGDFLPFEGAQPGDRELLQDIVIYFEFDSSEIQSQFNAMLAAHARYIESDPSIMVRLEGHADERGSREYNIGLGERRAQAVRQILLLQGVPASQISTISYGEERPAAFGDNEEAYALNRRVELVYR